MHHPYVVFFLPIVLHRDNAPPLRGIFSAHCLKSENGLVKMSQYSDQINENVVTDESPINDDMMIVHQFRLGHLS